MRKWINKNIKTIIITAFLIPIFIVGIVSITHVTTWYETSNPSSWALYLSIGVEIAALSALAAISVKMGKHAYLPFIIVTIIQFIGNIFYSFYFIDVNGDLFKSWIELVGPVFQFIGVEATNIAAHKGILSLLTGGLLPIISLTFLYSLVRFVNKTENEAIKNEDNVVKPENDQIPVIPSSELISEISKIRPSEEDVAKLQTYLEHFKPKTKDEIIKEDVPDDLPISDENKGEYPLSIEELDEIRKVLANTRINESNKTEETPIITEEIIAEEKKTEIIDEKIEEEIIENQEIKFDDLSKDIFDPGTYTDEQIIEDIKPQESIPEPIVEEIPYEDNIEPVVSENIPEETIITEQAVEEPEIKEPLTESEQEITIEVESPIIEPEKIDPVIDIDLVTEFPDLEPEIVDDIGLETEFPSLDVNETEPSEPEPEIDTTYIEENVESTEEQSDGETKKKV